MKKHTDSSRESVERILKEGLRSGADREALRTFLFNSERGRGNTKFHPDTQRIVDEIRDVLNIRVIDTSSEGQKRRALLFERRRSEKLSPHNVSFSRLHALLSIGKPMTRSCMWSKDGYRPIVLTRQEFEELGSISFVREGSSETWTVEAADLRHPGDVFILFPSDVADVPYESEAPVKNEPVQKESEAEKLVDLDLHSLLCLIFEDSVANPPQESSEQWEEILRKNRDLPFRAIQIGRQQDIHDAHIRYFVHRSLSEAILCNQYAFAARLLRSSHCCTEEQLYAFETSVAKLDPAFSKELLVRRKSEKAHRIVDEVFKDVPANDAELQKFLDSIPRDQMEMPAGFIIDGRRAGVSEIHLRAFAREVILREIKKCDYAWIARFVRNMDLATEQQIVELENLVR